MNNIIFVCTGNTCRSPMAEVIFNEKAARSGVNAHAISRGIFASGYGASTGSAEAVIRYGCSLDEHQPTQVTENDMVTADRVYGMTADHVRALRGMFPYHTDKIYSFPNEIPDPFGSPQEVYDMTAELISDGVDAIIEEYRHG